MKYITFILLSMAVLSCGNEAKFAGKSKTAPSTITVCQPVPIDGSYTIKVIDGEIVDVTDLPQNIIGSY